MDLIPTQEEVIAILRRTGALRDGHFERGPRLHTSQHLETALAMRDYRTARILSVALSRHVRADIALRAALPELSIVAATTAGVPIAYGMAEVLKPSQVYWVDRDDPGGPARFPQFLEPGPGEKVLLVDDVLHTGRSLADAAELLKAYGAEVLGIAVLIHQPDTSAISFGQIPVHWLAALPAPRMVHPAACEGCRRGAPLERSAHDFLEASVVCAS